MYYLLTHYLCLKVVRDIQQYVWSDMYYLITRFLCLKVVREIHQGV